MRVTPLVFVLACAPVRQDRGGEVQLADLGRLTEDFHTRARDVGWVDRPLLPGLGGAWQARSGLGRAYLLPDRALLVDRRDNTPDWTLSLSWSGLGRGGAIRPVGAGRARADGPRWEGHRDGAVEWFENGPDGLRHGFDLHARPPGEGPVVLELTVEGLTAQALPDGARFLDVDGTPRAEWRGLAAWDADGRDLPVTPPAVDCAGGRCAIRLAVDDASARWPIVVDPLLTVLEVEASLSARGPSPAWTGFSLDLDGDSLILGNPGVLSANAADGLALILDRNEDDADEWGVTAELDPATGDLQLGYAVALDHPRAALSSPQGRAVHLYANDGAGWDLEATITGSGGFGTALALEGDNLVVGAPNDDFFGIDSGSVWVFNRSAPPLWGAVGGTPVRLAAAGPGRLFGASVALSGDRFVAGEPNPGGAGKAHVFRFNAVGTSVAAVAQLTDPGAGLGDEFGAAVALEADRIAVGAPGDDRVYVFDRAVTTAPAAETWSGPIHVEPVGATVGFGAGVALSGDWLAVTDRPPSGEARLHLFERRGGTYAPVAVLAAGPSTGAAALPVRMGPGVVAVGVPETASFRVWRQTGSLWISQEETWYQPGVGALLGISVDVSGPLVAVGASGADFNGADAGAVAVWERADPDDWNYLGELYGDPDSAFGSAVALSGDLLLIGAPADAAAGAGAGKAELHAWDGLGFDLVRTFDPATDIAVGASDRVDLEFGAAVDLDGLVAVIGAPGRQADNGVGYLFGRNVGGADAWGALGQIAAGVTAGDQMGRAVAVGGGVIAVGSSAADGAAGVGAGKVVLAELDGVVAVEVQTLEGAAAGDDFGKAIAIDADWIAVGAPGHDADVGEVVLYRRGVDGGPLYDEVTRVTRLSGGADRFGVAVALAGDQLYAGAPRAGVVEQRRRNRGGADAFGLSFTLVGSATDQYGYALAAAGDLVAVGEPATTALGDGAIHLHVADHELPPVVSGESYTMVEDGPGVAEDAPGLLANDFDPNGDPLSLTVTRPPRAGSTFTWDATGSFSYAPPPDFDGTDTFDYQLSDGVSSATATVTLVVTPVNDAPRGVDDGPLVTDEEQPLSVVAPGVLANDVDVDDDPATLVAVLVDPPDFGALVLDPTGSFVYTPDPDFVGEDAFTYRPRDPSGATAAAVATVRLVVGATNDPPTVPTERAVGGLLEDQAWLEPPPGLLDPVGVQDVDGDPLTAVLLTPPEHGAVIVQPQGSWIYTPDPDWSGEDRFTWAAFDGLEYSAPSTVVLTVAPVNDPPVGVPDGPFSTDEDRPLVLDPDRLLAGDLDVEDDPRALSAALEPTRPPEHGAVVVDPASGSFVYTPDPDWNGTDTLWYRARDLGGAESAPTPVQVVVRPVNDAPRVGADDLGDVRAGETVSAELATNDLDPEGDPLTFALASPPLGGDATVTPEGRVTYQARASFVGQDRFLYVAQDGEGAISAPAVVEVLVLPPEGTTGPTTPEDTGCPVGRWYVDADGDGWGDPGTEVEACAAPEGYVARPGDCDDTRAGSHPEAVEQAGDGLDQDCDGVDNDLRPSGACATGPAPTGLLALAGAALLLRRRRRATPAAASVCGEDTPAEVDQAVEALWLAYEQVDETTFDRASKNLDAAIACLDRAPTPVQVARLHQAMGLVSFVNGQTRAGRRSLAAARLLDPGWKLDEATFPTGHPYRDLWASATDPGPVQDIGRIAPDVWVVDGFEREEAPTERAFLLQVASDGRVVWSGYLWSFEEIPDRGQATARSPLETPFGFGVSASAQGRVLASRQLAEVPVVWDDASGTAAGAGLGLELRATPITVLGAELEASVSGPADPVLGGDVQPSAHAVALLGGGGWVGKVQPHASARVGAAVDRVRAWTRDPAGETADRWTVPSLLAGLEVGARTADWRALATVDGLFGAAKVPWDLRLSVDGGWRPGEGPLALEGGLRLRSGGMPYEDLDGTRIGVRREVEARLSAGVAAWF